MTEFSFFKDSIPGHSQDILSNNVLSLNTIKVDNIIVTNPTEHSGRFQLRLDGVTVFVRKINPEITKSFPVDIFVKPGQTLATKSDVSGAFDVYGIANQSSQFNSAEMILVPRLGHSGSTVYEHPLNAGHALRIHGVVASRKGTHDYSRVQVRMLTPEGPDITLMVGYIHRANYLWAGPGMVLTSGGVIAASADPGGSIDLALIVEKLS